MNGSSTFQDLARSLGENPESWTSEELQSALKVVEEFLTLRLSLSPADAEDVASDVMLRFFKLVSEGRLDQDQNPASYLLRAAQWKGIDFVRSQQFRERKLTVGISPAVLDLPGDDDVAAAFDAGATADVIIRALTRAKDAGDQTAYSVVTIVLDEIERTGSRPSNRTIATQLNMSHPGVAKALERFRGYLAAEESDD